MPTKARTERASVAELKKFANKVRKAGGGNTLDALMPATPQDTSQCLIAKNLNFNCQVGDVQTKTPGEWTMSVDDEATRDKIAKALKLETIDAERTIDGAKWDPKIHAFPKRTVYAVILPPEIGRVAEDFDEVEEIAYKLQSSMEDYGSSKRQAWEELTKYEKRQFRQLWPYIEESRKEAYKLATLVTDDGKIVYR